MKKINLKQISFGSYIKLFVIFSVAVGVIIGIIAFLGSLMGAPVQTHFLNLELVGVPAGILSLVLGPISMALVGLLGAIVSYLPFKFILKMINGISLKGE